MRWHPDRNADPAAVEHFKTLRAAYEHLLEQLEQLDPAAAPQPAPQPATPPARGADRRLDLVLTLEEGFLGCEKPVQLVAEQTCTRCDGSGEQTLSHSRLCEHCHGSGRVQCGERLTQCDSCGGRGYRNRQTCPACEGSGRERALRTILVKVPPGLLAGDELRIAGEGEPCSDELGQPGDLRLKISLAPHALYALEGRNLRLQRPLSLLRLLAGGPLQVPLPGGSRTIVLEPGTADARALRVEGAGYPGGRNQPAGTLIVDLLPVLPVQLPARLLQQIAHLDAELDEDPARFLPAVAQWEADWLQQRTDRG
jgi:molecular chaperone DnaJ